MRGTLRCERCGRLKREFDRPRRFARFCQPCAAAYYLSLVDEERTARKREAQRRLLERVSNAKALDFAKLDRDARRQHGR